MKVVKVKSGVWNHFNQHTVAGVKYGSCKDANCPSKTSSKKRNSEIVLGGMNLIRCAGCNTSNLWYHLETFHREIYKDEKQKDEEKKIEKQKRDLARFEKSPKQATVEVFNPKGRFAKFKKNHPSQKNFHLDLEELIVNEGLPFRLASSLYFRKMVYHLEPRVVVNHPTTYSLRLRKKQKFVKRKVKSEMKNEAVLGVGFTADGWESKGGDDYLGITRHFIDQEWQLRRLTLACCPFEQRHTGNNIQAVLEEEVTKIKLGPYVAKTIVTDEASNMKKGRRLDGIWNLNCANHKLQNSIKDVRENK